MSTTIRPEVSGKNPYWISKHRYYELKHFCLQYNSWAAAYKALDGRPRQSLRETPRGPDVSKPTETCAESRVYYSNRMELVRKTAREATDEFHVQLLKAVTEGLSYEHIRAQTNIPCSKDAWYDFYRKFFWLLDKARE